MTRPDCRCGGDNRYEPHDLRCPERWVNSSFADATEAAVHYALIEFSLDLAEREQHRTALTLPDLSDIYKKHRRVILELATGERDSIEYLEERD